MRSARFYYGTDMETVAKFLGKMGYRRSLKSLGLHRRFGDNNQYPLYESVLESLGLGSARWPLTITNITFERISFDLSNERYQRDLSRMRIPQLRKLQILECRQFAGLLNALAQFSDLRLNTFHCKNPRRNSPDDDTTCIQTFLLSISGLNELVIHATLPWMIQENPGLAPHTSLEVLELRWEDKSYPETALSTLSLLCSNLVTLGIQIDVLANVIKFGAMNKETRKTIKKYLQALTNFHLLENLTIFFSVVKPQNADWVVTARNERFHLVANTIRQILDDMYTDSPHSSRIKPLILKMKPVYHARAEKYHVKDMTPIPDFVYEAGYEYTYLL